MRRITLALNDLKSGKTAQAGLYAAINVAYPDLGLTAANSTIVSILPSYRFTEPLLTRALIQLGDSPEDRYEFFYNRFDVEKVFVNPYWTAAEITAIKAFTNSAQMLAKLTTKSGYTLTASDIWVDSTAFDKAGGTTTPNWFLQAVDSSIYFTGKFVMWFHAGPS